MTSPECSWMEVTVTRAVKPHLRKGSPHIGGHQRHFKYSELLMNRSVVYQRQSGQVRVLREGWSVDVAMDNVNDGHNNLHSSGNLPLTFLDSYELVRVKKSKSRQGT